MPTYSYECECGYRFIRSRSIKESVGTHVCPECGLDASLIISGGAATILVGSNWPGKQVKLAYDSAKILRDGGEIVNNPDNFVDDSDE